MPEARAERLQDQEFAVVAVSADRTRAAWEKHVRERRSRWHHVFDGDKTITGQYGVSGFPTYLLVDDIEQHARALLTTTSGGS